MTRLLPLLLLSACYTAPGPRSALDTDKAERERMARIWVDEGLPDPRGCEHVTVVWPASRDTVEKLCERCTCGEAEGCNQKRYGCSDSCYVRPRGQPTVVVSRLQPRGSYRHEVIVHHWARCLGMRNWRAEDPVRLRVLREVERDVR